MKTSKKKPRYYAFVISLSLKRNRDILEWSFIVSYSLSCAVMTSRTKIQSQAIIFLDKKRSLSCLKIVIWERNIKPITSNKKNIKKYLFREKDVFCRLISIFREKKKGQIEVVSGIPRNWNLGEGYKKMFMRLKGNKVWIHFRLKPEIK